MASPAGRKPAYHTAIAIIPPAELTAAIDELRAANDKAYARWPVRRYEGCFHIPPPPPPRHIVFLIESSAMRTQPSICRLYTACV